MNTLRKRWNYEADPVRCENCASYRKNGWPVTRGAARQGKKALCVLGNFPTKPAACCDMWRGKNGDVLEGARP